MTAIEFEFQDVLDEIQALQRLAEPFISAGSRTVLPQLGTVLESIRDRPTDSVYRWGIENTQPLRTATSYGYYQPSEEGQHNVFAELTSVWEVRRIRPPGKKEQRAVAFALAGLASTRVRLMEEKANGAKPQELAMWRMEIGDTTSPGCHFHVQVLGETPHMPPPR